ncbi:MAG: DUF424 family protein [Candidatus Thermoplasmatota archaeon]
MKIHRAGVDIMVAACDASILGKVFEEGELRIEVSENFYDGMRVDKNEFIETVKSSTIANLVGKNVIKYALEAGIINKGDIIEIKGIPHAQIVVV